MAVDPVDSMKSGPDRRGAEGGRELPTATRGVGQILTDLYHHDGGPDAFWRLLERGTKVRSDHGSARPLTGDQELWEPLLHHGDLVVTGHLYVPTAIVVTGSLTVGGCLFDREDGSRIVVGGNLTARAVFSAGDLLVRGDLGADIVSCVCLDPRTTATGTVRARLVLEEDPGDRGAATVDAGIHLDYDTYRLGWDDREGLREQLRALLVDEVFTKDDDSDGDDELRLDRYELFDRLLAGEPVFHDEVR
ncbi:hypothetical protein [Streptomyces sp. EN16]|uniref:hypothetical protein n=1 Tax=Streptomyces sp. EN16 TaxID=212773 RepID=UPI00114CD11F|nr:hypothetical protein [Streptomyces sp. EN16]